MQKEEKEIKDSLLMGLLMFLESASKFLDKQIEEDVNKIKSEISVIDNKGK